MNKSTTLQLCVFLVLVGFLSQFIAIWVDFRPRPYVFRYFRKRKFFSPYLKKSASTRTVLRVPFCKNQTNFKFRGKGRKFDFAHILMVDSLGYDKNNRIVFLAKYPFISKKYANYQSPLKSSFDAPFY